MRYTTLHQVITEIEKDMDLNGFEYIENEKPEWMFKTLNYGETERTSFPIQKNGKILKKWYHAIIQRMENGIYELINYAN